MSLRERGGKWHWRFECEGREWSGDTDLAATERNRPKALLMEAQARERIRNGEPLRVEIIPFSEAADRFIDWAKGEHREKPNTWKRQAGSMTSLKHFFRKTPLHTITVGRVQDYVAWRRSGDAEAEIAPVREVTVRHDLHALSPLFKYGMAHNWCRSNPVGDLDRMPSDQDSIRMRVLSRAEEMTYFQAATQLGAWDLHDLGRLMILQGACPGEILAARAEDVGEDDWKIPKGKRAARTRILPMTVEARSILLRRSASASNGQLFGKVRLHDIENRHKDVLKATGLSFVPYDLRHTFATRFYQATHDIATLVRLLGHANLRTVMRYVNLADDHRRAAMKLFEQAIGNAAVQQAGPDPDKRNEAIQ
jgi:integrase